MNLMLILEQLLNGLIAGSMYALMGAGLAIVYGTMRVMNFAHGEFFMFGGYILYACISLLQWPVPLAILATLVATPLLAALANAVLVGPLLKTARWEVGTIVSTLAFAIVMQAVALRVAGEEYHTIPYYVTGSVSMFGVQYPIQRILILVIAIAVIVALDIFLSRTKLGWALRATSQDADAASVVGISKVRIFAMAFAISGLLAAFAVIGLAPIQSVNPWMGVPFGLKAFVVVILGGMGSLRGTILAGFLLGIVETVGLTLTSSEWKDLFFFGLLLLILWFRPEGLFGKSKRLA